MNRARGALGALGAVLAVVALGCGGEPRPYATTASVAPASGKRLAVLAPAAAETIALLGRSELVVGVGDWVAWPPELAGRPKLGAYDAPSEERLLELGVERLITTDSAAGRPERAALARLGIEVVELETATLEGSLASIERLGVILERERAALALVASIRAELARISHAVAGAARPRTLVAVGRDPLYVAGPGSHLDELVRIAGGENVAADLGAPYALGSEEALRARLPEVILDSSDNRPGALRGFELGSWASWGESPAVARGRVVHLDPIRLSIPGPRIGEMAALVARLLHPERFGAAPVTDLGPLDRSLDGSGAR